MAQEFSAGRASGVWLAVGAAALAISLVIHGLPEPDVGDQMLVITADPARWLGVHWLAAAGLSCLAIAGLIVLAAGTRLTATALTVSAWAVLTIGATWTLLTAVAEATVVTDAAIAGNGTIFAAAWAFSEGMANGFAGLALAVAVIAGSEMRAADSATPAWASGIAVCAGIASFLGWALWSWLDFGFGAPIWVGSSTLMCLWLVWFGAGFARFSDEFTSRHEMPSANG